MIIRAVKADDWFEINTAASGVLPVFTDDDVLPGEESACDACDACDVSGGGIMGEIKMNTNTKMSTKGKNTYAVLGRESYRPLFPASLLLCDFGGSTKRRFTSAFECACAEFHQESCGAFMSLDATAAEVMSFVRGRVLGVFHCLSENPHEKDYIVFVIRVTRGEAEAAISGFARNRGDVVKRGQETGRHRHLKDYLEKDLLCGINLDLDGLRLSQQLFRPEFFAVLLEILPSLCDLAMVSMVSKTST